MLFYIQYILISTHTSVFYAENRADRNPKLSRTGYNAQYLKLTSITKCYIKFLFDLKLLQF